MRTCAGLSSAGLAWAFTSTYAGNWHPLTWVSYLLEYEFFGLSQGLSPAICHLTNLVIHVASVVALFLTLRRMTGAVGGCLRCRLVRLPPAPRRIGRLGVGA